MKDSEILENVLLKLVQDFDALDSISEGVKDESASNRRLETLATLANSRNKLARSIVMCLLLKGDPKFKQLVQGDERDLAKLVRSVLGLDRKQGLMTFKSAVSQKTSLMVTKDDR